MATQGNLHTTSDNHAVKEAVITFFVDPSISDPSSYKKLLDGRLKSLYQKFEPIKQIEVKIAQGASNTEIREMHDAGFKMIGFKFGATSDIVQGINQPGKSLFTFNTVNYENWSTFYSNMLTSASEIANFKKLYSVKAFSLLFIDEFYYNSIEDYKPSEFFNKNSQSLPQDILSSNSVDFNLNLGKEKQSKHYLESLSLKVIDDKEKKTIQIIDNITFVLSSPRPFSNLLNEPFLKDFLDFAHEENKNRLIDVLNNNICKLIGIC